MSPLPSTVPTTKRSEQQLRTERPNSPPTRPSTANAYVIVSCPRCPRDAEEWVAAVDDSEAPTLATLTTKKINRYHYPYWQWSEDWKPKSEYVAPLTPNSRGEIGVFK